MPLNPRNRRPLRVLAALVRLVVGLYGLLASVHTWGEAQLTPKLGLDLEGGTQLILEPKVVGNRAINQGQIDKAVDIIRQRVDGSGVAEAEVATAGWPQHRHLVARQAAAEHRGLPQQVLPAALPAGPRRDADAAPAPTPSATPTPRRRAAHRDSLRQGDRDPVRKATTPAKATAKPSSRPPPRPARLPRGAAAPAAATPSPTAGPGKAAASTRPRPPHGDQRAGADPHRPGAGPDGAGHRRGQGHRQ